MFLSLVACGPLSLGCEAILDFDRTPLQPVVEASAPDASPADGATKKDGSSSGGDGGGQDAGVDANNPPVDAGADVDGDAT
jgi:hypothetical protein